MKKRFKEYSITIKIAFLILLFVFPLNIFVIINNVRLVDSVKGQVEASVENVVQMYTNQLDLQIERADEYIYEMFLQDPDGVTMCAQKGDLAYENAKLRCRSELFQKANKSGSADGYFFYLGQADELIFAIRNSYSSYREVMKEYLSIPENRVVEKRWQLLEAEGLQWLICVRELNGTYFGSFINLDEAKAQMLETLANQDYEIIFTNEVRSEKNDEELYVEIEPEHAAIMIQTTALNNPMMSQLSVGSQVELLIAFLTLTFIPILYYLLQKLVVNPLRSLNEAHRQLEHDNPDYRITETGNSKEFGEAFSSFNEMADNIHDLKIENMEKELNRRRMELENLQLQIRPHFLLNTFNLIFNLVQKKQDQGASDIIVYLSEYFRYIFRSQKELELFEKELHLIEGYMNAAKMRYPDGFTVSYQMDPEIHMVRVPPLLIHNFIENIIHHGLVRGRLVHIMLCGAYLEGKVIFEISDDGRGMEKEVVESINSESFERKDGKLHVGVQNSLRRLKWFYGEEAVIKVESESGYGTVFTIMFPYDLEERDQDETIDSK